MTPVIKVFIKKMNVRSVTVQFDTAIHNIYIYIYIYPSDAGSKRSVCVGGGSRKQNKSEGIFFWKVHDFIT